MKYRDLPADARAIWDAAVAAADPVRCVRECLASGALASAIANSRRILVVGETMGFTLVVAEDSHLVGGGKFGEFGDRFLGFGFETHEGADRETHARGLGAQEGHGALLELPVADLRTCQCS